jgi:hypothetical protein
MLTDAECKNATCPSEKKRARLACSGGLYLEISPAGSKRWFWKYRKDGKESRMALGTERKNGVLIYVLLADHAVEIVADRGIHAKVGDEFWFTICQNMQRTFSKAQFETGALEGIAALASVIGHHFPSNEKFANELSDAPVMLT